MLTLEKALWFILTQHWHQNHQYILVTSKRSNVPAISGYHWKIPHWLVQTASKLYKKKPVPVRQTYAGLPRLQKEFFVLNTCSHVARRHTGKITSTQPVLPKTDLFVIKQQWWSVEKRSAVQLMCNLAIWFTANALNTPIMPFIISTVSLFVKKNWFMSCI